MSFDFLNYSNETMKRKFTPVLISIAVVYFFVFLYLAFPYRLFPGDDYRFLVDMSQAHRDYFSNRHPVFYLALGFFEKAWSLFSKHRLSTFLFTTLFSNSVIIFFLGLIVYKITKKYQPAVIAALLYASSAWTANYHFFFSYITFALMLMMASLYFLLEGYQSKRDGNNQKAWVYVALSGAFLGLFFWSGNSSIIMVLLILLVVFLIFQKAITSLFIAAFLGVFSFFWSKSAYQLLNQLSLNLHTDHYQVALRKFGYIPKSPFLSFFHIGIKVYAPVLFIVFLLGFILYVIYAVKRYRKERNFNASDLEKALRILLLIIFCHCLLLDWSQFTKLGRTQFLVYPLLIIAMVLIYSFICNNWITINKKSRPFITVVLVFLFLLHVFTCGQLISKVIKVRTTAPKYLDTHKTDITYYALKEDPHSTYIRDWLDNVMVRIVKGNVFKRFIAAKEEGDERIGLLVGPTGLNSGKMSIIEHRIYRDLTLTKDLEFLRNLEYKLLPYYATFPTFMMEEEVMQALYLKGKTPDYKLNSQNIKLYVF